MYGPDMQAFVVVWPTLRRTNAFRTDGGIFMSSTASCSQPQSHFSQFVGNFYVRWSLPLHCALGSIVNNVVKYSLLWTPNVFPTSVLNTEISKIVSLQLIDAKQFVREVLFRSRKLYQLVHNTTHCFLYD